MTQQSATVHSQGVSFTVDVDDTEVAVTAVVDWLDSRFSGSGLRRDEQDWSSGDNTVHVLLRDADGVLSREDTAVVVRNALGLPCPHKESDPAHPEPICQWCGEEMP